MAATLSHKDLPRTVAMVEINQTAFRNAFTRPGAKPKHGGQCCLKAESDLGIMKDRNLVEMEQEFLFNLLEVFDI